MKKDIGLVFGGGGAKGSYQIGVWKAMKEIGVDRFVGAVSGTSIGALNAALFCTEDYEKAFNAWMHVNQNSVLIRNKNDKRIKPHYESWFSNAGVKKMIDQYVNFNKITTGLDCYATASRIDFSSTYNTAKNLAQKNVLQRFVSVFLLNIVRFQSKAVNFHINDFNAEEIHDILLASSAIPFVFPDIKINNNLYVDGGLNQNIPIEPLYKDGFRKFIVVTLEDRKKIYWCKYKNAEIIVLNLDEPDPVANFTNTFDFSTENIAKRLKKGYQDCIQKADDFRRLSKI